MGTPLKNFLKFTHKSELGITVHAKNLDLLEALGNNTVDSPLLPSIQMTQCKNHHFSLLFLEFCTSKIAPKKSSIALCTIALVGKLK